jgi:hypothetical protein
MRLAIDGCQVRETADADGEYVRIHGRESGFAGLVLRWIGIDATTSLSIDDKRIRLARRSLGGTELRVTPLASMASVACGCSRPWKGTLMLAAGGLLALAIPGAGWLGGTALLLLAPAQYFATSRLYVELADHGGNRVRIEFDRAAVADMRIDESTSARLVSIVEMLRLRLGAPRSLADEAVQLESSAQQAGFLTLRRELSTAGAWRLLDIFKSGTRQEAGAGNGPARADGQAADPAVDADGVDAEDFVAGGAMPMRLSCLSCGAMVQLNDVYCGNCGHKLPFLPG